MLRRARGGYGMKSRLDIYGIEKALKDRAKRLDNLKHVECLHREFELVHMLLRAIKDFYQEGGCFDE